MNKQANKEDMIYTIKAIREAANDVGIHIDISLSLIYPHPIVEGIDLEQSYNETLDLIEKSMPDSALPNPPAPFPGSQWFLNEKYGFKYSGEQKYRSRKEELALIAKELIYLEYILYLPPTLWNLPKITLHEMTMLDILEVNSKLRDNISKMGIELDLGDEHFLILRAAGYEGRRGASEFKRKSMQSIISCNYNFIEKLYDRVNQTSENLANQSK